MFLFSQCTVAAAMVAASTNLGYQTVKNIDSRSNSAKATVMWRQPSSCSTCSGGSSCGSTNRNNNNNGYGNTSSTNSSYNRTTCSRCQSFHRHNHRQRRRSSQLNTTPLMGQLNVVKSSSTTNVVIESKDTELIELATTLTKKSPTKKKEQTTLMGIGIGLMATGMAGSGFAKAASSSTPSVHTSCISTTTNTTTGRHCTFADTTITIPSPVHTRRNRTQKPHPKSSLKQPTPSIHLQRPSSSYSMSGRTSKETRISISSDSDDGSLSSIHIIE